MNTAIQVEENVIRFGRDEWLAMQARRQRPEPARKSEPRPQVTLDPFAGWRLLCRGMALIFFDGMAQFYGRLANRMLED